MTLEGLITQAYPSPEWVVFFEVSNSTGFRASRRADAVALGVWPSRGHMLIGFEFKEDRRDWLREKKNPEKAEAIAAHCDSWYVVAGAKDIVKIDELPEPWGLQVASEDRTKLRTLKPAVPFPDRDRAVIKRDFASAMLRKIGETMVPKREVGRLVEERVKAELERTSDGHQLKQLQESNARYLKYLDAFREKTGIDLMYGYQGPERIAEAVKAVLGLESYRDSLTRAERMLDTCAKEVRKALVNWPEPSPVTEPEVSQPQPTTEQELT